jgi:hypothetical protein
MTPETILTNARIILSDAVIHGTLVLRDGLIAEVQPGRSHAPTARDCEGDDIIPGLVDVHTDNLERQVQPRANARWPSRSAFLAHDAQCAAAGVTTPAPKPLDGINLLPLLVSDAKPTERTFFWRIDRSNRKQRAIRQGPWKYINDGNTMDLLFNLQEDIGERTDLGYQHPEILEDLKSKLKAWEAEMDATEREILVR